MQDFLTTDELLEGMLKTLRGSLNSCPEVAGSEVLTSSIIANFLSAYRPHKLLTGLGGHGVAAVYESPSPGPTVMIRCDLDALACDDTERTVNASRSTAAHQCGHDGHMAIVAGLAPTLHREPPVCGRVVLLFQPAEETGQGALAVMQDADFNFIRPDYAMALHNLPGYPIGHVVYRRGTFASASVGMQVRLVGLASHAAEPERARSPAATLSRLLAELPLFSCMEETQYRLLTVTHARMGRTSFGITPGRATLCATLRATSSEALDSLRVQAEKRVRDCGSEQDLFVEVCWVEEFPATKNDDVLVDALERGCHAAGIAKQEISEPFRWSEDFGHFGSVCPILHFGLGIGTNAPGLHQSDYEFQDEVIMTGVRTLRATYRAVLESLPGHVDRGQFVA